MATIVKKHLKKGTAFYISYRVPNDKGIPKQRWVRCKNEKEAHLLIDDVRQAEKEKQLFLKTPSLSFMRNTEQPLRNMTVSELMDEYIQTYGVKKWEPSTLLSHRGIIRNYINPYIGDVPVSSISAKLIQNYYDDLPNHKAVQGHMQKKEPKNISVRTVKEVHKILRPALNLAVVWGLLPTNPSLSVQLPKQPKFTREQWTGNELAAALAQCNDELTYLCICLVFACSLRTGELAGLTWDNVLASEESIQSNNSCIYIEKTLQRAGLKEISEAPDGTIIKQFPSIMGAEKTALILKTPKTDSSIRRIYLPATVARLLIAHKQVQEQQRDFFGSDYHDYGLVISQTNGNPYDVRNLSKRFKKFTRLFNLRDVDFYSLRHSSTTEKLRETHDVKAVQGDTGHSTPEMIHRVYAGIIDEDRKNNAVLMERIFFKNLEPTQYDGRENT